MVTTHDTATLDDVRRYDATLARWREQDMRGTHRRGTTMKARLALIILFAVMALAPIATYASGSDSGCAAQHYGEDCTDVSTYDPNWDYDVTYWADQAQAGTLSTHDMMVATLYWQWRLEDAVAWAASPLVQPYQNTILQVLAPGCQPVAGNAYRAVLGLQLDIMGNVLIGDNVVPYHALCQ